MTVSILAGVPCPWAGSWPHAPFGRKVLLSDHGGDQVILGHLGQWRGEYHLAVPQHGDVGADLEDLLEVVRDVQDRDALGLQLTDALEQPLRAPPLDGRGGS